MKIEKTNMNKPDMFSVGMIIVSLMHLIPLEVVLSTYVKIMKIQSHKESTV